MWEWGGLKALQYFWLLAATSERRSVETVLADKYELQSSVCCNILLLLAASDLFGPKILTRAQVHNNTAIDLLFRNTNSLSPEADRLRMNTKQANFLAKRKQHSPFVCTVLVWRAFRTYETYNESEFNLVQHPYQKCGHMRRQTPQDEHPTAPLKPPAVWQGCKAQQ
jgi:hypothetical protein